MNGREEISSFNGGEANAMYGTVSGIVVSNQDPQGWGRVQVKFPAVSESEAHWAAIATPMAGKGRGIFFLPEVDDEVLVAFEHGDITRPYVIGALWNGQDTPPIKPNDKNDVRLICSRSGHRVRFDDTDGSEKIEILDKSGENAITWDTAQNAITIKAGQDITLSAPQGCIKLEAQTIEIKSTAETNLNASATMTLKGSTINLN
jgi:uncharacterized protein involved in type VI secretion and phage assembly